ncbi:YcaQ family DNA glycosylase [Marivirga sp. S37H4]|uniref:YcaQ family DNA glycosylase n=1 Tax=Marivirga aurantiaca TaxID=2802615 RepID=A0A935C5Y2_9BACT|nr:crosslink repair DNA glycosylase YcaQ family protein [Marivirga aurantiaca]MBK6263412.1 YcaQ family DNA glycosylase [Marivirga aurantiaca]
MDQKLTLKQLQRITLESQGLLQTAPFGKGKKAVLNALEHLGYLQIDTLSVVERAHHHTLWTRIPDYKPAYLDELVKERKVFEYWFHAASYLPMKDFRYALPQMLDVKQNESHYYKADPKVMQYVMDAIRAEGPKKARDFESESKKAGSWWNWKPTKLALERLFMQGDLMISERNGMQKTYDITERVLPENIDLREPSSIEFTEYLVKTYLRAYGFTTVKQITHLKTGKIVRRNVNEVLESMLQKGKIQKVNIEGMPSVFIKSDLAQKAFSENDSNICLLSPFDNAIIHHDRIKQFFDFDFRLECYTPKEKRQYGYFCLPILFGDVFIGRVDCKAHRKEKQFEIIHLHIENQNVDIALWLEPFIKSIKSFATFNGCQSLVLTKVSPSKLTDTLKRAI